MIRPKRQLVQPAPAATAAHQARAERTLEGFARIGEKEQAALGLRLQLVMASEVAQETAGRLAELIFTRALERGTMLVLESAVLAAAGTNRHERRQAARKARKGT